MPRHHKTLPRLFVGFDLGDGAAATLDKAQSNYLAAVLRKRAGDEVVLFNGRDGAWLAQLVDANKKAVALRLVQQFAAQPPVPDLWLGFAPLKTARLDYVIQKATEMGAGIIQPVITRFTQLSRINHQRMTANAVEAAEQCEVLSVPTIAPEIAFDRLLADWQEMHGGRQLIVADESEAAASPLPVLQKLAGQPVGLLIGPEGGFAEEERQALRAKPFVVPISLGPRILRADTAAVAALAVLQASIGDWR